LPAAFDGAREDAGWSSGGAHESSDPNRSLGATNPRKER
jgi:hypothetical protein